MSELAWQTQSAIYEIAEPSQFCLLATLRRFIATWWKVITVILFGKRHPHRCLFWVPLHGPVFTPHPNAFKFVRRNSSTTDESTVECCRPGPTRARNTTFAVRGMSEAERKTTLPQYQTPRHLKTNTSEEFSFHLFR